MTPRIWDISQRLDAHTPLWPGEPDIVLTRTASIGPDCPVNIGAVSFPLHAGTHADAPLHYSSAGQSSADCDLSPYLGRCLVADVRHASRRVEMADCDWPAIEGAARVLFRTYERFPREAWDAGFTAIAPDVVARLRESGTVLIGTDAASLDPQTSKTMDAHKEILAGQMRILEGLVLDAVPAGEYELIALPLAIVGADASPIRAILREIME